MAVKKGRIAVKALPVDVIAGMVAGGKWQKTADEKFIELK